MFFYWQYQNTPHVNNFACSSTATKLLNHGSCTVGHSGGAYYAYTTEANFTMAAHKAKNYYARPFPHRCLEKQYTWTFRLV